MGYSYVVPDKELQFHKQDNNTYCGAACAQMVLHSLANNLATDVLVDQQQLQANIDSRAHFQEPKITCFPSQMASRVH